MNIDSRPDYGKPPTFEEVVAYANEAGLYGKVPLSKFYDFYAKQGFQYNGYLMDWKSKMREWAERQRTPVRETCQERNALPKEPIDMTKLGKVCLAMGFSSFADCQNRMGALA